MMGPCCARIRPATVKTGAFYKLLLAMLLTSAVRNVSASTTTSDPVSPPLAPPSMR
jgi:hypothetical protein